MLLIAKSHHRIAVTWLYQRYWPGFHFSFGGGGNSPAWILLPPVWNNQVLCMQGNSPNFAWLRFRLPLNDTADSTQSSSQLGSNFPLNTLLLKVILTAPSYCHGITAAASGFSCMVKTAATDDYILAAVIVHTVWHHNSQGNTVVSSAAILCKHGRVQ